MLISTDPSQLTVVVVMSSADGPPDDEDRRAIPKSAREANASAEALKEARVSLAGKRGFAIFTWACEQAHGKKQEYEPKNAPRTEGVSTSSVAYWRESGPLLRERLMADDGDLVQWLSHGVALPADLHPESYSFLRRLAEASARRDAAERQVALAAQGRAAEHAAELEEVEDTLQQCGLTPSSLPTAVSSSLGANPRFRSCVSALPARPSRSACLVCTVVRADTLASSAAALGLRDTSLCSLYNALDALEVGGGWWTASSDELLLSCLLPLHTRRGKPCQSLCLQMEEAEMKSAVEGDKALCASLRCRLSDCEGLVQLLHNTERECRSKAEREGEEQAGRLNDMATLEKKSVQYKEVSAALLLGYADIAQQCACHVVPTPTDARRCHERDGATAASHGAPLCACRQDASPPGSRPLA